MGERRRARRAANNRNRKICDPKTCDPKICNRKIGDHKTCNRKTQKTA